MTFIGIAAAIAGIIYAAGSGLLRRKPAGARDLGKVADVTIAYFRESDVDAKVDCVFVEGKGLVALIEVDPQIRFRSSYIIEQTLKEQILRLTGKHLAEVFWRFPMIEKLVDATHAGPAYAASKSKPEDLHYDIGEVSWEEYERAMAEEKVRKDSA
ncbi:MAG: hypothetical protein K2P57_03955 [Burkholderiales bacterium]|nr:hypothetical protein [Burkholderiales bacterium]